MVYPYASNFLDVKFFSEDSKSYIEKKIDSFLALESGWHFGEGGPPSVERVKRATTFIKDLMAIGFDIDAFPGIAGEIHLTFHHDNTYLEVIFDTDGSISFWHDENKKEIKSEEEIDIRRAKELVLNVGEFIWNLSELSTQDFGIKKMEDLTLGRLANREVIVESQYFPGFVSTSTSTGWESAGMFITIIGESLQSPRFS